MVKNFIWKRTYNFLFLHSKFDKNDFFLLLFEHRKHTEKRQKRNQTRFILQTFIFWKIIFNFITNGDNFCHTFLDHRRTSLRIAFLNAKIYRHFQVLNNSTKTSQPLNNGTPDALSCSPWLFKISFLSFHPTLYLLVSQHKLFYHFYHR